MAYDQELAHRVREILEPEGPVVEKPMFGGLAMMIGGHMAVCVSGRGGLLVRAGSEAAGEQLIDAHPEHVTPMVMGGREARTWLQVDVAALADDDALRAWVARGVAVARSLPPK